MERGEREMSDPNEKKDRKSEYHDLELEPEMVKDLDVSDDKLGEIRGGCSFTPITLAQR
jgi:hypothetical protein